VLSHLTGPAQQGYEGAIAMSDQSTRARSQIPDYREFIAKKSQLGGSQGFEPTFLPDALFDFQRYLTEWLCRRGRGAALAACGLGKTLVQLCWAENVARRTGRPVLVLTPLAVSAQTVREGEKFGVECRVSRDGKPSSSITVTNYEQLHRFNPADYSGVACDEASAIKNFAGSRRKEVTEFLRETPYRLLCTATPSPNDFVELGTLSEALGELGHMDMLARFFKNDDKTLHLMGQKYGDLTQKGWRFKPHAEESFWRWVCSWARACRKPSDLGPFDDARFMLPNLTLRQCEVKASRPAPGHLFDVGAVTLEEQREEQRRTLPERCEKVAELLAGRESAIAWCHLNGEGDLLERLIPDSVQVKGSQSDDEKEERFAAFCSGQARVLVCKPAIGGFGLNFQHCARQTFFVSHSWEQFHQCVRRSWRFGQERPVVVDLVTTDGASKTLANLKRKQEAAERMFERLVALVSRSQEIGRSAYGSTNQEVPAWLS
jgi:hypothetical protein